MTVTYDKYNKDLRDFCNKHNKKAECKVYTSPMINNCYHKEYCYSDGATFCEITDLITEEHEVTSHGLTFKVNIEMWRTEYWSTDNSHSKYFYEKDCNY